MSANGNKGYTEDYLLQRMREVVRLLAYYRAQYGERPWITSMEGVLDSIWQQRVKQ